MSTQNCIALYLAPSLGLRQAGIYFLPVPTDGVPPDLLADVARYLHPAQDDYRGVSLNVTSPTWEAVRVAVDREREERAKADRAREECAKADRAREEAEAVAKAERSAKWRASAARYLAGEEVKISSGIGQSGYIFLDGIDSDRTEACGTAELVPVREEYNRRCQAAHAEREKAEAVAAQETAAKLATIRQALRALLVAHGTPDHVERFDAGVLANEEASTAIRDALLPESFGGASVYTLHTGEDIDHDDDCRGHEDGVTFSVEHGDGEPLSASQWETLKAIRAAAAQISGAVVDVRKRVADLGCTCANPSWLTARVRVKFADADLEVQRQYALD